jgi:hypothetical protein
MEAAVRGIEKDGLVWGASEFVAVGFGIKKVRFPSSLTPLPRSIIFLALPSPSPFDVILILTCL